MPAAVVVALLVLSAVSAAFAFSSPRSSPPPLTPAKCSLDNQGGDPVLSAPVTSKCGAAVVSEELAESSYYVSLMPYRLGVEASEALLLVAFLIGLLQLPWTVPGLIKSRLRLPSVVRAAGLATAVAGLTVFSISALLDISNFNPEGQGLPAPKSYPAIYNVAAAAANSLGLHSLVADWAPASSVMGYGHFGVTAFAALAVAGLGFVVFRSGRGVLRALRDGITFAAFALFFFEIGILSLENYLMVMQAANFASFEIADVPLVSNWLVLLVSTSVLVLGLGSRRLRLA